MEYHPAANIILDHTTITRPRMLPEHVGGRVLVKLGVYVQPDKIVAEATQSLNYQIIDLVGPLGIDPDDTEKLFSRLSITPGQEVQAGELLAQPRRRRDRKLIPKAPARGVISLIEHGQVILQINADPIPIYARIPGTILEIVGEDEGDERGVVIESTGALIQCAWGNGSFRFGTYEMEPQAGLLSLYQTDSLLDSVAGRIYVLERPIVAGDLRVLVEKRLGGLVAPSMSYHLRETAIMIKSPIILTEGFGNIEPTQRTYEILRSYQKKREGAFDATMPGRWEQGQPEIVLPTELQTSAPPEPQQPPLAVGMSVRIRRAPYEGKTGEITGLPRELQLLESGLRVPAAQVKLYKGKLVTVPLANLEFLGDTETRK